MMFKTLSSNTVPCYRPLAGNVSGVEIRKKSSPLDTCFTNYPTLKSRGIRLHVELNGWAVVSLSYITERADRWCSLSHSPRQLLPVLLRPAMPPEGLLLLLREDVW